MRFKPYIEAVFATTDDHKESDLRKAKRKSRMTLLGDIAYENYHEQMSDFDMYTSWHYEKSKGLVNGYVITGYELHLYNEHGPDSEHKIISLPCVRVNTSVIPNDQTPKT